MNQILSTSMPMDDNRKKNKVKSSKPIDTRSILKFFAIIVVVFGISMIGTGVMAIYKNQMQVIEQNLEPTISIENKTERTALLKVMHQRVITKVEYAWNKSTPVVVYGNNGKYLEKEIKLPAGKNTLHVLVQDENGKEITYDKEYDIASNIDVKVSGNKIKITYEESDTLISYMTYRWDEGEENTITINDTSINKEIEAMKGLHQLTIVVVDENNNTDTKVQKIKGVSKPNLEIDFDDEIKHFVIKTSDEEQLEKVEFKLNYDDAQNYVLNLKDMNLKELVYTLPMELQVGENVLEVTVYNKNGLSEYTGVKFIK